jgi:hypothetical protein
MVHMVLWCTMCIPVVSGLPLTDSQITLNSVLFHLNIPL